MKRSARTLRDALVALSDEASAVSFLASCSAAEIRALAFDWEVWAREDQLPPTGNWTTWMILGGRGAGKTRAGAEWVRGMALGKPPFASEPASRIALIGETIADVREVMIEGVSGLLSIHPRSERPDWLPSRRRLTWPNGSIAQVFSAEDPEGLRGPQFHAAWADELAKWRYAEETWDMLQFGLRLGRQPRQIVTTTPRPIPLLKRLMDEPGTVLSRAATRANAANLAPGFLDRIVGRYADTRLGRQELDGELIEDRQDALWHRQQMDVLRVSSAPELTRIVVAVDPPASSTKRADACGIIVAGICANGVAYVLKDSTLREVRPTEWASKAAGLMRRYEADALVVEVNQGGEMVETVIREVDPLIPVKPVRATRGKWVRAEPVAALYEQGRVRHVGGFADLEDEMCDFGLNGLSSGKSPDRMDALVWALTALMLGPQATPQVRSL